MQKNKCKFTKTQCTPDFQKHLAEIEPKPPKSKLEKQDMISISFKNTNKVKNNEIHSQHSRKRNSSLQQNKIEELQKDEVSIKQKFQQTQNKNTYLDKVNKSVKGWMKNYFQVGQSKEQISIENPRSISVIEESQQSLQLENILKDLDNNEITEKALRHFYDGYLIRTPRQDIDGKSKKKLRIIWTIIYSPFWNRFCWCVFWEPPHSHNEFSDQNQFRTLIMMEAFELVILLSDFILGFIFLLKTKTQKGFRFIFEEKKMLFKFSMISILFADFILFLIYYPDHFMRFARPCRSLFLISYSKRLRRNILGVINSLRDLLLLFLLYFLVISLWAFIGVNLLGDIDQVIPEDYLASYYSDFFKFSFNLYILSTLDYYPDIMLPSFVISRYYFFYFLSFVFLFLFLFNPVPQALLYENFKKHRDQIEENDKIKQKKALTLCFFCLDEQQTEVIPYEKAESFFSKLYKANQKDPVVQDLLLFLDFNQSKNYSFDQFLIVFSFKQLINKFNKFSLYRINGPQFWSDLISFLNNRLKLKQVIEGVEFNILMIILTFINCILIIVALFLSDQEVLDVFEIIDKIFFGIYVSEFILKVKILALGFYDYFDDVWNQFDFSIIFFQFLFDFVLMQTISNNLSSSVKANRVLRLAKIQKIFRLFRAFRSVKLFTVILDGLKIFEDVKSLFFKIIMCLPIVLQFTVVIWVLFYTYSVIAVEILYYHSYEPNIYSRVLCDQSYIEQSDMSVIYWGSCEYSDFQTIERALMMFIQIYLMSWSDLVNDFQHRVDNYWLVAFFIGSFVFFTIFLTSLINGLVWEIFNNINENEDELYDQYKQFFVSNEQSQKSIQNLSPQQSNKDIKQKISIQSGEQNEKNSVNRQKNKTIVNPINEEEQNMFYQFGMRSQTRKRTNKHQTYLNNKINQKIIKKSEDLQFSIQDDFQQIVISENLFSNRNQEVDSIFKNIDVLEDNHQVIKESNISQKQKMYNEQLKCLENKIDSKDSEKPSSQEIEFFKNPTSQNINSKNYIYNNVLSRFLFKLSNPNLNQKFPEIFENDDEVNKYLLQCFNYFEQKENELNKKNSQDELKKNLINQLGYQEDQAFEQIKLLQQREQELYYNLQTLLKYDVSCKIFIENLITVEKMISQQFLPLNGFTKFLFQNQNNSWFTIYKKDNRFHYKHLGDMQWAQALQTTQNNFIAEDNIYFYEFQNNLHLQSNLQTELAQDILGLKDDDLKVKVEIHDSQQKRLKQYALISVFSDLFQDDQNYLNQIIQIWYYDSIQKNKKKNPEMFFRRDRSDRKPSYINLMFLDKNNPKSQSDQNINKLDICQQEKHSLSQTISLSKDIWKLIRGNEQKINTYISDLEKLRLRTTTQQL